jgi:hypothetical protein
MRRGRRHRPIASHRVRALSTLPTGIMNNAVTWGLAMKIIHIADRAPVADSQAPQIRARERLPVASVRAWAHRDDAKLGSKARGNPRTASCAMPFGIAC